MEVPIQFTHPGPGQVTGMLGFEGVVRQVPGSERGANPNMRRIVEGLR